MNAKDVVQRALTGATTDGSLERAFVKRRREGHCQSGEHESEEEEEHGGGRLVDRKVATSGSAVGNLVWYGLVGLWYGE